MLREVATVVPTVLRKPDPRFMAQRQFAEDNVQDSDYQLDESQLLQTLRQDASYHETHKLLLTKALKWERQHQNPSILLQGPNRRRAEAWLQVARDRSQHGPIPIQEHFIAESLKQPPATSLNVFFNYSRTDSDFVRKLNSNLQILSFSP